MVYQSFNYVEHYRNISLKYDTFLKDFKLLAHLNHVIINQKNPYSKCRFHADEPETHAKAKNKIFELFLRNRSFLTETELSAFKQLNTFDKDDMAYRFDILVINVPNFVDFENIAFTFGVKDDLSVLNMLKELEQALIFGIEIDGTSHSDPKDKVRDDFFFDEYNIVTVRYRVDQLIKMEETEKEKRTRIRYSFFKKDTDPIFQNITTNQIVQDVRNIYRTKYPHLS